MFLSKYFLFVFCVVLTVPDTSGQLNVGLTKDQIDKAIKYVSQLVGKDLKPLLKIPDLNLKGVVVSNIKITGLTIPKVSIKTYKTFYRIKITDLGVDLSARWKTKRKIFFKKREGTLTASARGISIYLDIDKKTFKVLKCKDSIGSLSMKFKGKGLIGKIISAVANLFRKRISKAVKKRLRGEICKRLKDILKKDTKTLSKLLTPKGFNIGFRGSAAAPKTKVTPGPPRPPKPKAA